MESTTPVTQQSPEDESSRGCRFGRGHGRHCRGFFALIIVALVAGFLGAYIGKSYAHGFGHFGGPMAFTSTDPAKIDERVERMVRHFAVEVDATPAQQEKLKAIAKSAARDLVPVRDKLAAGRKQAIGLIGAASVDRSAIERLRTEQIQLADTASKRVTQALADVAEVLTPAQRQKIAAHMQERVERFEHWRHG
jgi:Spy/CpxP family protein refolding chaperone